MIGAIERYDPDREIKFETYAIARIKGAIIDELRALDWVPRSVRARARDIERAIAELEKKLHRAPTDEEIADKLGLTEEELGMSLTEISRSSIAALDELWTVSAGGDQVALIDTIEDTGPEPQSLAQMKEALGEAIARLPEREKLVVTLYYYEELTLREIGEVLGVTSRGSRSCTRRRSSASRHASAPPACRSPRQPRRGGVGSRESSRTGGEHGSRHAPATAHRRAVRPGEEGWDEGRTLFNAMIDKRPAAIARPDVGDVAVHRMGAQERHGAAVRAGGHSVAGRR